MKVRLAAVLAAGQPDLAVRITLCQGEADGPARDAPLPGHLYAGTQKDNMADMVRRGRARNRHTGKIV